MIILADVRSLCSDMAIFVHLAAFNKDLGVAALAFMVHSEAFCAECGNN